METRRKVDRSDIEASYGTFDQGGNVSEWNETSHDPGRGLRRGDWVGNDPAIMHAQGQGRSMLDPASEFATIGFRLAGVPEPDSLLLVITAAAKLLTTRRKRATHNI